MREFYPETSGPKSNPDTSGPNSNSEDSEQKSMQHRLKKFKKLAKSTICYKSTEIKRF